MKISYEIDKNAGINDRIELIASYFMRVCAVTRYVMRPYHLNSYARYYALSKVTKLLNDVKGIKTNKNAAALDVSQ